MLKKIKKYNSSRKKRQEIASQFFQQIKTEALRKQRNHKFSSPSGQLRRNLLVNLYDPYWERDVIEAALEALTPESYERRVAKLFQGASSRALLFGNLNKREARKYQRLFAKVARKDKPIAKPASLLKLDSSSTRWIKPVEVSHADNAVLLYVQGPDDSDGSNAKVALLGQMLSAPFFNSLRTEQQLGYVVYASRYAVRKMPGLVALVQSPTATTDKLLTAVDEFLESSQVQLFKNFERDKQTVLDMYLEKPKSQQEYAADLWWSVLSDDHNFDLSKKLHQILGQVSRDDMQDFYKQVIASGARRLWLVSVQEGDVFSLDGANIVRDSASFKAGGEQLLYP